MRAISDVAGSAGRTIYKAPTFTIWTAIGYGLFSGVALLISPVLLLTLIAFLVFTVRLGLRMPKAYALWLVGIIVTAGLVLLPWAVRNVRVLWVSDRISQQSWSGIIFGI